MWRRVAKRGNSYGATSGFFSLGVDVDLFVWVDVVYNGWSEVYVRVAILPLGEVVVRRGPEDGEEKGGHRQDGEQAPNGPGQQTRCEWIPHATQS